MVVTDQSNDNNRNYTSFSVRFMVLIALGFPEEGNPSANLIWKLTWDNDVVTPFFGIIDTVL